MTYADRREAGQRLGEALSDYAGRDDVIVLALPRGGLPVGQQVAHALGAPLDVLVVRKLGVPGQEELAFGAIAIGNARVLNHDIVRHLGIDPRVIERVTRQEQRELQRREQAYRGTRPLPTLAGKHVILIDDGLATGATMRAAIESVRQHGPLSVIVAVPVAPPDTCLALAKLADEVVCPLQPPDFGGVGRWYREFEQLSDEQVRLILDDAWRRTRMTAP